LLIEGIMQDDGVGRGANGLVAVSQSEEKIFTVARKIGAVDEGPIT
jgi:hypothetical protein